MTDQSPASPARRSAARNPAPRPALPRRTRTEPPGPPPAPATPPATGRDVIIPNGQVPTPAEPTPPAVERAGRKGRATTVPSVADLMPPKEPTSRRQRRSSSEAQGAAGRPSAVGDAPSAQAPAAAPHVEHVTAPPAAPAAEQPPARPPRPAPRPALVRPALPTPAPRPAKPAKGGRAAKGDAKATTVVISLPKGLRKRLKAKAAEHGMKPEQAVTELVRIWVDG